MAVRSNAGGFVGEFWMCVASLLLAATFAGSTARAQCGPGWLNQFSGWRANNFIQSATWWDPDGAGSQPQRLVIAQTNLNDTASLLPLVWWDGETWNAIDTGIGAASALVEFEGRLTAATATSVRRWDGSVWQTLGTPDGTITSLAVFRGELYAAGAFLKMNGTPASRIARWTGSSWQPLAGGVDGNVAALLVFGDRLIAAGSFVNANGGTANRIAQWDGNAWTQLGAGLNNTVNSLCDYRGRLVAGGSFSASGTTPTLGLASFDGASWSPVGGGVAGAVAKLAANGGDLYVAGPTAFGGVPAKGLAKWNATAWEPLDFVGSGGGSGVFRVLEARGEALYVGGFSVNVGPDFGAGMLQRVGNEWRSMGLRVQGPVRVMAQLDDGLYTASDRSGGVAGVVRWNGVRWVDFGKPIAQAGIFAIRKFQGDLIVAGSFANGSAPAVLRWSGTDWVPLGPSLQDTVYRLEEFNGELYAAGRFDGPNNTTNVARFDGTTWQQVGLSRPMGFWTPVGPAPMDLRAYNGRLYLAGGFGVANNGAVGDGIAAWDGETWSNVGHNSLGAMRVLTPHEGTLYAAGTDRVWRNDGTTWSVVGGKFNLDSFNGGLFSLTSTTHGLVVGGGFISNADNPAAPVPYIARWDAGAWRGFGTGAGDWVRGIAQVDNELFVAGYVAGVDGRAADGWARWSFTGGPTIGQHLESITVESGSDAVLRARAPDGYHGLVAQWFRDGVALVDGPGGASIGGGTVQGSRVSIERTLAGDEVALAIKGVRSSDAGTFYVSLSNECGEAVSVSAALVVTCAADFNSDGQLTFEDFDAFVVAFEAGQGHADANADSFLTFEDVDAFVAAFEAGC